MSQNQSRVEIHLRTPLIVSIHRLLQGFLTQFDHSEDLIRVSLWWGSSLKPMLMFHLLPSDNSDLPTNWNRDLCNNVH